VVGVVAPRNRFTIMIGHAGRKTLMYDIISQLEKTESGGSEYYKLQSLHDVLSKSDVGIASEELSIMPYYRTQDGGIYELYDFEARVYIAKEPELQTRILNRAAKQKLEDIDPVILNKLQECYIELCGSGEHCFAQKLLRYTEFVLYSKEIKIQMLELLNEYNRSQLLIQFFAYPYDRLTLVPEEFLPQ